MIQVMVPYNYTEFINGLTDLVYKKAIRIQRIDDAVRRILRVKFAMGLFENPLADYSFVDKLGSKVSVNSTRRMRPVFFTDHSPENDSE
jgi:beta-glucosidase-like glycosyl hydrolase